MQYDTIVIGSGISGLTAALTLARNQQKVAVFEQWSQAAPLLTRFKRKGCWCNPGFHYSGGLLKGEPLRTFFNYLGFGDEIEAIPLAEDGFDKIYLSTGKSYSLPNGLDNLREYLKRNFGDSSRAIDLYIDTIREIMLESSFSNFDLAFGSHPSDKYSRISLQDFLQQQGAQPELIELLGKHGKAAYGTEADEVPFILNAYVMGSFYQSACMLKGGGDAIIKGMLTNLKKYGAEIFLNEEVKEIEIQNKRFRSIITRRGRYRAKNCVSSIHPQLLQNLIRPAGIKPAFFKRVERMQNTYSPLAVYFELQEPCGELQGSNHYFWNSLVNKQNGLGLMAINPAEREKNSLVAILACDYKEHEQAKKTSHRSYNEYKRVKAAEIESQIYEHFPQLRGKLRFLDLSGPYTYERYTRTVKGSIFGLSQSVKQRSMRTQGPAGNLYICGQSVIPGVLGAMVSSFLAVSQVLESDKFWEEVQKCN